LPLLLNRAYQQHSHVKTPLKRKEGKPVVETSSALDQKLGGALGLIIIGMVVEAASTYVDTIKIAMITKSYQH
jgi:hypothetical protein